MRRIGSRPRLKRQCRSDGFRPPRAATADHPVDVLPMHVVRAECAAQHAVALARGSSLHRSAPTRGLQCVMPIRWSGNQVAIAGNTHRMTIASIMHNTYGIVPHMMRVTGTSGAIELTM